MKNSWIKFALVFLGWIIFSAFSVFAANIIISTDFNTATQYLKKIVVLDWNDNEKLVLDGNNVNILTASWNAQIDWNIFAEEFCQFMSGTESCINPNWMHDALNTLNLKLDNLSWLLLWVWTQTWLYNYLESRMSNAELEIQILHYLDFWSENSEAIIPNVLQTVYLLKNAEIYWDLSVDRNASISWNLTVNHNSQLNWPVNILWTTTISNNLSVGWIISWENISTKILQLQPYNHVIQNWDLCNNEWELVYSLSWNNWNLYFCERIEGIFVWKQVDL